MLLALLCAAAPQPGLMAVLELKNKLKGPEEVDAGFLADEVRAAALKTVPGLRVITRENMLVLLKSTGRKLEECEGECEVDTGRRIGADLVVSGELLRFGTKYKLDLKLHETAGGSLLAGAVASGKTVDELDAAVPATVRELLAPLGGQKPPPPAATPPTVASVASVGSVAGRLETKREPRSGLEFVRVPAGLAHLGCAAADSRCNDDEKPPRTEQMASFYIGRTEVPVRAFAECARAGVCNGKAFFRDIKGNQACNWRHLRRAHPMNCVTFIEAEAFCRYAGGRLPTAAEWEYAARAGRDVIFPWGNDEATGARANFCDKRCQFGERADASQDDGWAMTAPPGVYPPNPWGLVDMAGNVSEWTATAGQNGQYVLKGGNWSRPPANMRASHKGSAAADHHDGATGFRCVMGG